MATRKSIFNSSWFRGAVSITAFLLLWQLGSMSKVWIKWDAFEWLRHLLEQAGLKTNYLPWIGAVPAPLAILLRLMIAGKISAADVEAARG